MLKWILCSDELPKEDETGISNLVLLTVENEKTHEREVTTSQLWNGKWISNVGIARPIAWSELPEPYQDNKTMEKVEGYIGFDEHQNNWVFLEKTENKNSKTCNCKESKRKEKEINRLLLIISDLETEISTYKHLLFDTVKLLKDEEVKKRL